MTRLVLVALAALGLLAGAAGAAPPGHGVVHASAPPGTPLRELGYQLYAGNCVSCHGPGGGGVPSRRPGAGGIKGAGPPLRGVGALAADLYLRTGYMPLSDPAAQPRRSRVLFSEREIEALVAYVASLGGPPVPKPHPERGNLAEGLHLFTDHCAGCHQVVAEGGYLPDTVAPALGRDSPVRIAEAVRMGPYLMPRFSKRQLSDRQLDSIIRYVRSASHPDDRGGWPIGHLGPVPEGLVTWLIAGVLLVAVCLAAGRRLAR